MAGLLSDLGDLLWRGEDRVTPGRQRMRLVAADPEPAAPLPDILTTDMRNVERASPTMKLESFQGAPNVEHESGLLPKFGKYLMSPEGMLALGTTIRASTGNENAFADQRSITNRWDKREDRDRKEAAQRASNERFRGALKQDANGRWKFDMQAWLQDPEGVDADMEPIDFTQAAELARAFGPRFQVTGDNVVRTDAFGGEPEWSQAPVSERDQAADEVDRRLAEARIRYLEEQAKWRPYDSKSRRISAEKPPGGGGGRRGPPIDLSGASDDELDAIIASGTGTR